MGHSVYNTPYFCFTKCSITCHQKKATREVARIHPLLPPKQNISRIYFDFTEHLPNQIYIFFTGLYPIVDDIVLKFQRRYENIGLLIIVHHMYIHNLVKEWTQRLIQPEI
jgi:hypothetical protein